MSELLMKMPVPYEPKRKNRWLIKFKGYYKEMPIWAPSKTSRPKWVATKTPKYPITHANSWDSIGDGDWADLEIYLRDPIANSPTKILMQAFNLSGKKKKIKYTLELLDPTGIVIEKWKIKGMVKEFDFGELDYSIDALAEIKMVIKATKVRLVF
jgi:hypothetical protein